MSSLLARFAENIFWIGRYLERAENIARVLHINETYSRDRGQGPNWRHILNLYGDSERFFAENDEASAEAVLYFYILDRNNPTSIRHAVTAARENARSVRHLISTEMWVHINIFYGQVAALTRRDIALSQIARLAGGISAACQTFEGIADGTFVRGEPWSFYQIGKYIERGDQTTRILDVGFDRLSSGAETTLAQVQWTVLLRSLSGYYAFRNRHPAGSTPHDIAMFLIYDTEFPRAVALCMERVLLRINDLEQRHGLVSTKGLKSACRGLEFALQSAPASALDVENLHDFVDDVQVTFANLSNAVGDAFFTDR